ncbi:MAG: MBL fold metallo-hydrolase [Thermoplasmata archaeon]|nr:MBL fold metallo-hydrolase [Thermoplasmata archaeon]
MKLELLCSDSMGVRSMALYIEADLNIIIDPSASLGPYRYGLRPTMLEFKKLEECKKKIHERAQYSDIIIITHYHYDHYDPEETFYNGKKILLKSGEENINRSQKLRFEYFKNKLKEFHFADKKSFIFFNTEIKFSEPFHHGNEKSALGFVISVVIENNKKILFTSDVEGPIIKNVADYIIKENPEIVIIDGPPTYFLGYKFSQNDLERSIKNLKEISNEIELVILDHHLLRDLDYRNRLKEVYSRGNVITYAEFNKIEINMLEAHRKDLYKKGEKEYSGIYFEE